MQISSKVTSKTKGVIPVHFTGQPCDMVAINAIAKEHKLTVIEDAAHGSVKYWIIRNSYG